MYPGLWVAALAMWFTVPAMWFTVLAMCFVVPAGAQQGAAKPRIVDGFFPPAREYSVYLEWPLAATRDGLPILEVNSSAKKRLLRIAPGFESEVLRKLGTLRVSRVSRYAEHSEWKPVYGERGSYPASFRGVLVQLVPRGGTLPVVEINIRAYDAGLAWRIQFPQSGVTQQLRIDAETTTYSMLQGTMPGPPIGHRPSTSAFPLSRSKRAASARSPWNFPMALSERWPKRAWTISPA